jgi:AcrR family transcriptional regulator
MIVKKKKIETEDKREVLLKTAARLFGEKGFEAVSTRTLAEEAKVNIAMIAYYFGSKEGLFKAMIEERFPKSISQLRQIQKKDGNAWDKISAVIDHYTERIMGDGSFHKLIFRELSLEQRPEHRELILAGIEKNWEVIKTYIAEGQETGLFKEDIDVELTIASVFGTVFQLINMPAWTIRLLGEKDEKFVKSEALKTRIRVHLKEMMKSHLFKIKNIE